MEIEIAELKKENTILKEEIEKLREHLKRYTAPERHKIYYENNKDELKQKVKQYKEKTNYYENLSSDKKKQYARTAYLKKKEKLKATQENI
jgi:hypothetical protein